MWLIRFLLLWRVQARLWDSTNERQVGLGSSSRCSTNNNGLSKLWGRLYVFNDTNQYSVQHWTESSEVVRLFVLQEQEKVAARVFLPLLRV